MKEILKHWRNIENLKLSEAALLLIGIYPDGQWADEKLLKEPPPGFTIIYRLLLNSIEKVINEAVQSEEYPDEFYTDYELNTVKPIKFEELSDKDKLSIKIGSQELKKWVQIKSIETRFFDEDQTAFEAVDYKVPGKPLSDRERKSLYRIIGALLITLKERSDDMKTETALISHLCEKFDGYEGLSKSKLEQVFPEAKRILEKRE